MDMTDFYDGASLVFMILFLMMTSIIPMAIGGMLILFLVTGNLFFSLKNSTR